MKILGIDDNDEIRKLLKTILTAEGHEFTGINNGREGLNEIKTGNYGLVLLDIAMPDFSGMDVVDSLKKDDLLKNQKVVLFTASAVSQDEINEMISKGVHSCLRKPVDIDKLLEMVESN